MNDRLESILNSVTADEFTTVARGALGSSSATLIGEPVFEEITTPHADLRTLGIVRALGEANTGSSTESWTAVLKILDVEAPAGQNAGWVRAENEETVYEQNLFTDDDLRFRPARFYLKANRGPGLKLIWLEDLSDAEGPPFDVTQLSAIAGALGEFNGFQKQQPTKLPFEPAANSFKVRWEGAAFVAAVSRLEQFRDNEIAKAMYRKSTVESTLEIHDLMVRLIERIKREQGSLSFGDSQPGNLFRKGDETVAIDWASLTMDPIGVDAGCLVGASSVWGRSGVDVALNERDIFESYVHGARSQGCNTPIDDLRRAFFGQFGLYLAATGNSPVTMAVPGEYFPQEFFEKRFETPWDEIPDLLAGIVDLIPGYVEELKQLLE